MPFGTVAYALMLFSWTTFLETAVYKLNIIFIKNPNWREANQLAILQSVALEREMNLGPPDYKYSAPNHQTTSPGRNCPFCSAGPCLKAYLSP